MSQQNQPQRQDTVLTTHIEKKPFVEPKLTFVEPKLEKRGDFADVTTFFSPPAFVPPGS